MPVLGLTHREVEAFYPSSIEYMLPHYTFVSSGGHVTLARLTLDRVK